ncbi:MAG TPA: DUF4062 domain-containing protein [Chloroflexota bacterium]|nr:DUF4062 domain-containing protein [Chloroflexota bacterium]
MPQDLKCYRVFIASPGGLQAERQAFREVVREYNEEEAVPRGVLFWPAGWEDTLGRVGRPQSIINEDVRSCDYFLLLLWDRWGSPPDVRSSEFSSGTEEEYHIAMECFADQDQPLRQIVMMFKAVDAQKLSDPGPQLQQVLEFKGRIEREKTHLFHTLTV